MSTAAEHHTIWVAYGAEGVAGSIRKGDDGYSVSIAGADAVTGPFPSMEIAKSALHARMAPGSDWPMFREH